MTDNHVDQFAGENQLQIRVENLKNHLLLISYKMSLSFLPSHVYNEAIKNNMEGKAGRVSILGQF